MAHHIHKKNVPAFDLDYIFRPAGNSRASALDLTNQTPLLKFSFKFSPHEPNTNDINEGVRTKCGGACIVPFFRLKPVAHPLPLLDHFLDEVLDFRMSKRAQYR